MRKLKTTNTECGITITHAPPALVLTPKNNSDLEIDAELCEFIKDHFWGFLATSEAQAILQKEIKSLEYQYLKYLKGIIARS